MTLQNTNAELPSPQIFTIFTLPSYEDAVKSPGDPPTYEQALNDPTAEQRADNQRVTFPQLSVPEPHPRSHPHFQPNEHRRQFYRYFCWIVAVIIILLLGYVIYMGIWKNMSGGSNT